MADHSISGVRTTMRAAVVCLGVAMASGCGASANRNAPRVGRPLAAYDGDYPRLFDDGIDANSVGLADVASKPRTDPLLRARTQRAELVGRFRVATVTADSIDGRPMYHVMLVLADKPLVQKGYPGNGFEFSIGQQSPSFGMVKWLDTRLIGRTFVGFVRQFAAADEPSTKFHLASDDAEVWAAVRNASVLGELGRR